MIASFAKSALLLACLTAAAIGQQATRPPVSETLEEVTSTGARERQRQSPPPRTEINPNVISVKRDGVTLIRLQPVEVTSHVRFRRESAARLLAKSSSRSMQLQRDALKAGSGFISDVSLELAPNIDEVDGLPASIQFGSRTSLVNIDYVRLRDTARATLINVGNVLDPQTRRCVTSLRLSDDGRDYPNRFMLVGDRIGDCRLAEKNREGDLFFADGVPEPLRQALRDIYEPVDNRLALKLGSEPGVTFVVWRPDHQRSDFRFERNWNRTNLLLLNGPIWQRSLAPLQRDELWESFAEEQLMRRFPNRSDEFTQSAVDYLLLLARSERDRATNRRLTMEVPIWIAACARRLNTRAPTNKSPQVVSSLDCGRLLQFVYDAVARAESKGKDTVFRAWRGLLTESFRRGESGVKPGAFIATSGNAQRITQGLMDGSMDWARFGAELDRFGVRLRIAPGQSVPTVEVLSLTNFHD